MKKQFGVFIGEKGTITEQTYTSQNDLVLALGRVKSIKGTSALVEMRNGKNVTVSLGSGRMAGPGSQGRGIALYENIPLHDFPEVNGPILVVTHQDGAAIKRNPYWTDFGIASAIHRLSQDESFHSDYEWTCEELAQTIREREWLIRQMAENGALPDKVTRQDLIDLGVWTEDIRLALLVNGYDL